MILSQTLGDKYEEKITYRIGWPTGNIWRSIFILPGSILVLLVGLLMLSYDVPKARDWLRTCQKVMSKSASKLDKLILDKY
jgi:hypothetical protein